MKVRYLVLIQFVLMVFGNLAQAESFRVLGRGLFDPETGSVLQMACVGELRAGEPGCESIQFLLSGSSTGEKLIGPVMRFGEDEKLTRRRILDEMRTLHLAPPRKLRNSFQAAKLFHLGESGDAVPAAWMMIGGPVGYAFSTAAFTGGLAVLSVPVVGGTLLFLGIPVLTDLARLPFQMRKARRDFGCLFGEMGPKVTVEALNSRSMPAWQLKPKRVSSSGFKRFLQVIIAAEFPN